MRCARGVLWGNQMNCCMLTLLGLKAQIQSLALKDSWVAPRQVSLGTDF